MDCSDASVDFCTALQCLIHEEKSKQAEKANNIGRKRRCSAKPHSNQAWVVYDSRPPIQAEPEAVLEGPLEDICTTGKCLLKPEKVK